MLSVSIIILGTKMIILYHIVYTVICICLIGNRLGPLQGGERRRRPDARAGRFAVDVKVRQTLNPQTLAGRAVRRRERVGRWGLRDTQGPLDPRPGRLVRNAGPQSAGFGKEKVWVGFKWLFGGEATREAGT